MFKVVRYTLSFLLTTCVSSNIIAQAIPDSVIQQYESAISDRDKLNRLVNYFDKLPKDSSFLLRGKQLIDFLQSKKDYRSVDIIQLGINDHLAKTGDYVTALASTLEITRRFEKQNDKRGLLSAYRQLSTGYYYSGDKEKDVVYGTKALMIAKTFNEPLVLTNITNNLSTSYAQKNIPDSALLYARMAVEYAKQTAGTISFSMVNGTLSEAFINAGQYDSALTYSRKSLAYGKDFKNDELALVWTLNDLSQIFLEIKNYDSSKYYAHRAADIAGAIGYKDQLQRAYEYLTRCFEKEDNYDSAFSYLNMAVNIKDSLYNDDKARQVQGLITREQIRIQEIEKEKIGYQNKIRLYSLIAGLFILGIIISLLYRNNRQKQKNQFNVAGAKRESRKGLK